MKDKGFTLIELLGVIIILALLMILVFPNVVNYIKNSSTKTDNLTLDLIYNASDLYISNHSSDFPKVDGNKFIISLSDLVAEDLLASPIKLSDSDDITNEKCVQVTYDSEYSYEIKDTGECVSDFEEDVFALSNYQKVEYIESTGTQYINTGVQNEIGTECELDTEPDSYNLYQTIIGSSSGMHVKIKQSEYFIVNTSAFNQSGRVTFKCGTNTTNRYIEYNGLRTNTSLMYTTNSIFLFAQNNNGTALNGNGTLSSSTFYTGKVYSLKITQNNKLIRDMVPCYHKTSGEIGMYDIVNDVFYTNAGTGTFLKGPDVNTE